MMRLSYITCPLVENFGLLEISLIIRDYHDNDNKNADEIKMTWDKTIKADHWSDPVIEFSNLFYGNAEHASKMLGMLYRLIEKGTKTDETDPSSIITELSRKNFRQIIFDKRVNKFLIKARVKHGKETMYSLPEKYDLPITVEAISMKSAISKVVKEFTDAGMENIEKIDVMKMWFEDEYPLDKLSAEDVPVTHPQKYYNPAIKIDINELKKLRKQAESLKDRADEEEVGSEAGAENKNSKSAKA